jgi:hypothetical protein
MNNKPSATAPAYWEAAPPKYDYVGDFSEGMARVRIGDWKPGKWSYIDKVGKEVVPIKYDFAFDFCEGMGHRNASTTQRYAHVAPSPAAKAVQDTSAKIADALRGKGQKSV